MNDLEMTKLCAEAMGHDYHTRKNVLYLKDGWDRIYHPLTNDAQAMALVKKFELTLGRIQTGSGRPWSATAAVARALATSDDLNRAIVECVALMQKGKK